jgi:hypothetical protein
VPGGVPVDLKQLALDGADSRHELVELAEISSLILCRLLDEIGRWAVVNAMDGISQLSVQEVHPLLQSEKLLTKLPLLDHRRKPMK